MVIAPDDAITDTGVLLSSAGIHVCDSVLCVSWSDHWILNPLNDVIALPGADKVTIRFWSSFLPLVQQPAVSRHFLGEKGGTPSSSSLTTSDQPPE